MCTDRPSTAITHHVQGPPRCPPALHAHFLPGALRPGPPPPVRPLCPPLLLASPSPGAQRLCSFPLVSPSVFHPQDDSSPDCPSGSSCRCPGAYLHLPGRTLHTHTPLSSHSPSLPCTAIRWSHRPGAETVSTLPRSHAPVPPLGPLSHL